MTDARRSTRVRKAVNYSKLCVDDSDDDFKDENSPSVPQSKRKRTEKSPHASKIESKTVMREAGKKNKDEMNMQSFKKLSSSPTGRISVSEKVLARDLQQAIEISKQCSQITEYSKKEESGSENENNDSWSKSNDGEEDEDSDWSENETKAVKAKETGKARTTKTIPSKSVAEVKVKKASPYSLKKDSPCNSKPNSSQSVPQPLKIPAAGLRLGLSRKALVKSLHPAVKVQQ